MSQFDINGFWEQLQTFPYEKDSEKCWDQMQAATRHLAESQSNPAVLPYHQWLNSALQIFAPYCVQFSGINYQASQVGAQEYVEIYNSAPCSIDISLWRVNAGDEGQDFIFPVGSELKSGQIIRIYTEFGHEYSFESRKPIWNNKGDVGQLFNSKGQLISSIAYAEPASQSVIIEHIEFDGQEKGSEGDEYIQIRNTSDMHLKLCNWKITSGGGQEYTFPEQTYLAPKSAFRVYTNEAHPEFGGFSFNSKRAIWNNKGDTAQLLNDDGHKVSEFSY